MRDILKPFLPSCIPDLQLEPFVLHLYCFDLEINTDGSDIVLLEFLLAELHEDVCLSNTTIPHESLGKVAGARVFLKPASAGTGVIAAGGVRAVLELAGVRDILTKSMGSANVLNVVMATFGALEGLRSPANEAARRGKRAEELLPFWERRKQHV